VLGQGSTSRVFLGIDIRDYHKVVLKLFKPMDEAKIRREIDILEQLKNCPNIVPLESVFRNEGSKNYTFVMPHYPGTTLNYIIKSLDVKQMKTFMQNILTAISFIHKQGIMHRDIKPSNILVCSNPTGVGPSCRIFDFGLAERYTPGQ
jgi:casein kinase II subunit alpha